jgi:phosphoglycolate phosphatase
VSRVALVVFDLDGTLIDSARDLAASVNAALERLAPGTPPVPPERVRTFIGDGAGTLVARTLAAAGVDITTEQALPVFLECYSARLLETTALYPGVAEALDALRDRRLAVLTNKPGDMSRTILEGLGVAGRFFRIYGAGDVDSRKPDPAGLKRIAEEAGVDVHAAVMVGDSGIDVLTGRAAGALTAGVTYGFDAESFRDHPPDLLVRSLTELADRLS